MPSRRIVRDEEYLKIATDPEAAMVRLAELRAERTKLHEETPEAASLVRLKEALDARELDQDARERKLNAAWADFLKEHAAMREALEKRELEAEDFWTKAADRMNEANARHDDLDHREAVIRTTELDLSDRQQKCAELRANIDRDIADFAAEKQRTKELNSELERKLKTINDIFAEMP